MRIQLAIVIAAAGATGAAAACGSKSSGPHGTPDASSDALAAAPIIAPAETWTWVPLDGMVCADGSPTGVGVNLTTRSNRVMVFFQGGGACWDATTCFTLQTAVHIKGGYGSADFATDLTALGSSYIVQRAASNPFQDASWIYVPYCTGDLHAGTKVSTFVVSGSNTDVHFAGRANAEVVMARVAATSPTADTVWLVGLSAGGFGVAFDHDLARAAWPQAAVHALADSAPLVTMQAAEWSAIQTAWAPAFPASCTGCANDLGAMRAALQADLPAGDRYGLLQNTMDATIQSYFQIPVAQLTSEIVAEQAAMAGTGNEAAFLLGGTGHVLLGNPAAQTGSGISVETWVDEWATGSAAWANAGP